MAMNSVELFFIDEDDDDFGFELLPDETEDPALSQWELVNPSNAGSDSVTDVESPSAISEVLLPTLSHSAILWAPPTSADGSPCPDNADQGLDQLLLAVAEYCEQFRNQGCSDDADVNDSDEVEGEDDDGLDDELVPRHLRGKLGRQRMRKLGKRACSKMNTSKRSPHLYVKPGCLYGKHGLGLKHSLC